MRKQEWTPCVEKGVLASWRDPASRWRKTNTEIRVDQEILVDIGSCEFVSSDSTGAADKWLHLPLRARHFAVDFAWFRAQDGEDGEDGEVLPPVKNRKSFVSQLLEDGRYGCFLGCNGGGRPQSHLGLDHPVFFSEDFFCPRHYPAPCWACWVCWVFWTSHFCIYVYCTYIFFIFNVGSQTGLVGVRFWRRDVKISASTFHSRHV